MLKSVIENVHALEIFDSRGNPTVEVFVTLSNGVVGKKYLAMLEWLAGVYVNVLNAIHYMHDKYYYEAAELALEDTDVKRTFATGIAGFSHVVDSLSAMKYAKVKVIREKYDVVDKKTGKVTDTVTLVKDFEIEGDFPRYGQRG